MIDVDALLELEAKATCGVWTYDCCDTPWYIESDGTFQIAENIEERGDAELISAMRNSIRELCLELKALREVAEAARIFDTPDPISIQCGHHEKLHTALKNLDEARRG
jgi:hypothetical protein